MLELNLLGVSRTDENGLPVVLLQHEDRILPIFVGIFEAQAIQVGLSDEKLPRPFTHDLICNILAGLGGELQSVTIYELQNETFFAHLNIVQKSPEGEVKQFLRVDSRPSDGIALAVRTGCPIYASEKVLDVAGQDISVLSSPDEPPEEDPQPE